eukprot:6192159-Pleurochrysis_carterae.AAC.4
MRSTDEEAGESRRVSGADLMNVMRGHEQTLRATPTRRVGRDPSTMRAPRPAGASAQAVRDTTQRRAHPRRRQPACTFSHLDCFVARLLAREMRGTSEQFRSANGRETKRTERPGLEACSIDAASGWEECTMNERSCKQVSERVSGREKGSSK